MLNTQRLIRYKLLFIPALFFNSEKSPKATTGKPIHFQPKHNVENILFLQGKLFWQIKTQPCHHTNYVAKLMKSRGTHSWVSFGSWKALTGIWLMRFRLNLRTWSVEPRWSRAPSSNTLILLLLRYLNTNGCHKRFITTFKHLFIIGHISVSLEPTLLFSLTRWAVLERYFRQKC